MTAVEKEVTGGHLLFSLLFARVKQFATHRFRVEKVSDWSLVGMSDGYKVDEMVHLSPR